MSLSAILPNNPVGSPGPEGPAGPAGANGAAGPAGPPGGAVASAQEVEVTVTTGQTVLTYTPTVSGPFQIGLYLRIITAATTVSAVVNYTDATGAQTATLLASGSKAVGSYPLDPIVIDALAGDAISVVVTAATADQVYASAAIWGSASTSAIASYDETVLTRLSLAPVAYWKLNDPVGSTTAADSSGNGYTLTVSGTVTFGEPSVVPSDSETSCKGDGSTGSLSVASASLLPVTGQYTAVACIQTPTLASLGTGYPGILAFGATYKRGFNITGNRNGSIPSGAQGPFMNANDLDDVSKVGPDGTNLLIGVTVDDASTIGYVNGRPELSMALGLQPTDSSGGATVLSLGAANYSDFPIGRVAIFAGILNPKDWALLMQAFTGVG